MALIPTEYLDTTVALGIEKHDGKVQFTGTGFLYGHPVGTDPSDGKQWFRVFLITNRHVVEDTDNLIARFNRSVDLDSQHVPLPLYANDGSLLWTLHPTGADVAVISIATGELSKEKIEFAVFQKNKNTLFRSEYLANGISEGNGVFVLGFPLGIAGEDRNYVIVRKGSIARIRNWLDEKENDFLIDASIFPGNSGGPVLTIPENVHITGSSSFMQCCLIGMVSSYLPYQERAISIQTGRERLLFEENSGLSTVVPMDVIQEVVDLAVSSIETAEETKCKEQG